MSSQTVNTVTLMSDVPVDLRVENRPQPISERLWLRMVQFGLPEGFARLLHAFSADGERSIPLCWVWRGRFLVQYDPQGIDDGSFVLGVDGPNAELEANLGELDAFHVRLFADGCVARWFDASKSASPVGLE